MKTDFCTEKNTVIIYNTAKRTAKYAVHLIKIKFLGHE